MFIPVFEKLSCLTTDHSLLSLEICLLTNSGLLIYSVKQILKDKLGDLFRFELNEEETQITVYQKDNNVKVMTIYSFEFFNK